MRPRALLAAVTAALTLILAAVAGALVPPTQDPFYTPPADLAALAPGTILRTRQVSVIGLSALSTAKAYQLLYRTTDASGRPIATVTTVLLPAKPAPTAELVADNQAYDSLTLACAPSYTLQLPPNGQSAVFADEETRELVAQGWTVTIPDYEGPDSEWTVGRLNGQAALDALRATERFAPAGLNVDTPAAMIGYSGGSIPTMWADGLWKSYAPELNLIGVAAGGLPANLDEAVAVIDGNPFFGTMFGVLVGVNRAYPSMNLYGLLNAQGKLEADKAGSDAGGCGGSTTQDLFGHVASYFNGVTSSAQLAALPQIRNALAKVAITSGPVFGAPAFLFHEQHDELAPVRSADELVAFDCAHGVAIDYDRSPLGEHEIGSIVFGVPAEQWLVNRFAGQAPPSNCPQAVLPPAPPTLHATPRRLHVRRRTRVRFVAAANGQPLAGARVTFLRRSAGTNAAGRAWITVTPHVRGADIARLSDSGKLLARVTLHVRA